MHVTWQPDDINSRDQGGLNRSSQHFMNGGCDGEAEAWIGSIWESADAIPRPAWDSEARG